MTAPSTPSSPPPGGAVSRAPFEQAAASASRASGVAITCTGVEGFGPVLRAGRFVFANGLTVILVPDMRAPIFAYQSWFKVGSKHEEPHRTGLAHLFEHLMFKGTPKHPTGTFDREMERRGSQTNAATWVDWTYYTEALAAHGDNLATVIDFEADRMQNLILDAKTFESELEVVKNERRMSVEDSVAGTLSEELLALAYREHPYRWPTIGSMAHLEAATLDDLRQFYRAFYAPNNATLVLVGALEVAPTLEALAHGYGGIAAQTVLTRPRPPEPAQTAARDKLIHRALLAPQLVVGYHAPAQNHPDYPALELIAEASVSGDTARLYQRLVTDEELATDISGFAAPFAEPGLFEFHVTVRAGAEPQAVVRVLQEELGKLRQGLTASELAKGRHGLELATLDGLKDVEGCAEALGHHQVNFDDFGRAFESVAGWQAVSQAQLVEVAEQVFRPDNRSVVIALPSGEAPDSDDAGGDA